MNLISKRGFLSYVNFNQDYTCLSIGTSAGFKLFNTQPKFIEIHSQAMAGIGICEMLFSSSLIAISGSGEDPSLSPRKLMIINTKSKSTICELNFVTPILSVKMNKKRLVVVMETKIHVYDISTMKILHTIDTCSNTRGVCALSPDDNSYVAYPYSAERGDIVIYDALSLQTLTLIHAHKTPLSKLSFSHSGAWIASASTKGTVIRCHSIVDSSKSCQFRRGSYPAGIHSLSFSPDGSMLAVSSDTGTIHIFKLDNSTSQINSGNNNNVFGFNLGSIYSQYIPEVISDMWETIPVRSFAFIKLPTGAETICGISQNNSSVMIVTGDGNFLQYAMDPKVGGELKLSYEYRVSSFSNDEGTLL